MTRFLADEEFQQWTSCGASFVASSNLDVVRVQDIGVRGADDDTVPTRAVVEGRVLLTHDVSTLVGRAFERIRAGSSLPGVIAVAQSMRVGSAIEDLVLVIECSVPEDWSNQVRHLPLREAGSTNGLWGR